MRSQISLKKLSGAVQYLSLPCFSVTPRSCVDDTVLSFSGYGAVFVVLVNRFHIAELIESEYVPVVKRTGTSKSGQAKNTVFNVTTFM
jgi:hypothetical protein